MDKVRVETFLLANRECFSIRDMGHIRTGLEKADDSKWSELSTIDFKSPHTALMLSIFGGPIGVDRLYIGDYLLGVFKTVTCGGLLVWAFVDQFLIRRATRRNNKDRLMAVLER